MAITLAEAKVGMADHVDQQVVDSFRRSSLLLDMMTFDNCISPGTGGSTLVYGYTQLLTPSVAATRAINAEYTAGEAKRVKRTANCIPMGGSFQVDRVIQNTSGAIDEMAFQIEQKTKATANYFHNLAVNGCAASSGTGYVTSTFDGVRKLLTGTSSAVTTTVDVSSASALSSNYNELLDEMDRMLSVLDGTASILMMNTGMLLKVRAAARRAGYYTRDKDDFGRYVERYQGVALMDAGKYYNGSASVDVIADTDATSSAEGTSSIIALCLGLDGFHGISPTGTGVVSSYMPDLNAPGAVKTGEVELVAGVALKSTLKAAMLTGIKTSPKTA